MIALIDGDIVAYRCAASCKEGDPLEISLLRADKMMREILEKTQSYSYKLWLSGSSNFRKELYPLYKANRTRPAPPYLQDTREFLVTEWNAKVTDGYEADDALGIDQTDDTIIASIDKDLLQVPGLHYNIVKEEFTEVNQLTAVNTFYKQLLLGDRSDNVPGFDGMARQKPTKQILAWYEELDQLTEELDMYEFVKECFNDDNNLLMTARLLYIWRKENDQWKAPTKAS